MTSSHSLLSGYIMDQIRQDILAGRLLPGERLIEADLAERFNTSKTPVREGIRDLERLGLVEMRPRRGAFVLSMSVDDIREIKEMRAAFEGLSARLALERAEPGWIENLEQLIEEMRKASGAADLNDVHARFHEVFVSSSGNSRLKAVIRGIDSQVRTFLSLVHLLFEDPDEMADNHMLLVEAIRSNDPEVVQRAVDEHILDDGGRLEQLWESSRNGTRDRGVNPQETVHEE